MPEEFGAQTEQAQGYFDLYSEADEAIGVDDGDFDTEGDTTQNGEEQQQQQQQTPPQQDGEQEQAQGQQQGQQQPGTQQVRKPPDGFDAQFYTRGDDGQHQLDLDGALNFLAQKEGNRFEYPGRSFAQPKPPDPNAQPEKPEWERTVEERAQYRQNLQNNMYLYRNEYNKAVQHGYNPQQAMAYADAQVQQVLDQELERQRLDFEKETQRRLHEQGMTAQQQAAMEQKASANEANLINRLGGADKYQDWMFGKGAGIVNKLFDLMAPDKAAGLTQNETAKEMNDWWKAKMAADPSNLEFVHQMIRGQWALNHLQEIIDAAKGVSAMDRRQRQRGAAHQSPGMNRPGSEPSGLGDQSLSEYLGYDPISRESVPQV